MHITGYTRDNVHSADAAAGGEWIVLIHGLLSSPRAMRKIKSALVARGYSVLNFGYDSRQQSIRTSAVLLDTEIKRVIPNTAGKIHFERTVSAPSSPGIILKKAIPAISVDVS